MSEFKIKTRVELDDKQAKEQLKNFKQLGEKEKIKLKVDMESINLSKLNQQAKQLQGLFNKAFKLDNKTLSNLKAMENSIKEINKLSKNAQNSLFGLDDNKTSQSQAKLIAQYKDLFNTKAKLENEMRKGLSSMSNDEILGDIKKIDSELDSIYKKIDNKSKLELFNFKNSNKELVELDKDFDKIQKSIEKIDSTMSKLSTNVTNKNEFKDITNDFEKFRNLTKDEIRIKANSGDVKNQLREIQNVVDKLRKEDIEIQVNLDKVDSLKSKFEGLESSIQQAFGDSKVDAFRSELEQLESSAKSLDNGFGSAFTRLNGELKSTTSQMGKLKNETSGLKGQFDDFYSSIAAHGIGDMLGDMLMDAVRNIKDVVVELDNSMRDMMKVAPDGFRGTTDELRNVKMEAVDVAKSVGSSVEDTIQGMSKALQTGAKTMNDALEIAKGSTMFANVGDLQQEQADTYIAAVMSAFGGMENALKPVRNQIQGMGQDYNTLTKFLDLANHAGNNYAISTGDVGEALMRSGSMLSGFNVSMEDSVAMIVGMNESLQNAEKSGTAMKSIATNLGGVKAALKDGSIESNRTAKALKTIAGIEVWDKQTGDVKNMTTTLSELNEVWDTSLTQAEKLAVAESVAGKNHINAFVALMDNWEKVIRYQEDYKNGMTIGSAENENLRFLDSIEGKWAKLRENLKSITTSVLSSNLFKGVLDGAIAFTDVLSKVFNSLDKMNMSIPATIGLLTSFGQVFKSLAGRGNPTSLFDSLTNSLRGNTVEVGKNTQSIGRLNKGKVTLTSNVGKLNSKYGSFANTTQRLDKSTLNLAQSNVKVSKSTTGMAKSFSQTVVGSKMAMVGTSLLNGALIGLAGVGISVAIKAISDYANRLEIAEEKSKANIDSINGEIKSFENQKQSLSNIAEEYDDLANKQNLTTAESERLKEITKQIAEIMPNLVSGYDESGDPILAMTGSASELIVELEKALEVKKRLLTIEQGELAKNSIKQMNSNKGGGSKKDDSSGYSGELGKLQKIEDNYNRELEKIYKKRSDLEGKMLGASSKDREKYAREISEIDNKLLTTQEKFNSEYFAQLSQIQEHSGNIGEYIFGNLEGSYSFDAYSEELQKSISGLKGVLDFSDVDSEEKMYATQSAIKQLADAASYGKVDLDQLKTQLVQANTEFAKTQDIEQYNQSISNLVEQVHAATGIDKNILTDIFSGLPQSLGAAETSLDKFMSKFDKTQSDIINQSDNVAKAVKAQYDAIQRAIEATSQISGIEEVDYKTAINLTVDENLPNELRDMVRTLLNKGANSSEVLEVAQKILVDMSDGEIDIDSYNQLIEETFGEGAYELTQDIFINTKIETAQTEATIEKLQSKFGQLEEPVETLIKANSVGAEADANKIKFMYDNFPEQVETWIKTLGYEGAYENIVGITEIYNRLPEEKKTKLIAEGENALVELERMNNLYQQLPPEVQTYIKANGYEALEQAQTVDEVLKNIPDEVKTKVSADTSEAESKLSLWEKLFGKKETKELKYKATADIGDAQSKVENLNKTVSNYDKAHSGKTKKTNFSTETSGASKNVTGLKKNVDDYDKKHNGKTKKTNFSTNTSTASKNVTGLKNNVSGYVGRYGNKTFTTTFNVVTSYSTKGTPTPQSSGIKMGRTILGNILAETNTYANDIQSQTLGIQRSVQNGIDSVSTLNSTRVNPMAKINSSDVMPGLKYNVNLLQALEDKLKDINYQLDILDNKAKNAYGTEKINYIKQQNNLLKQQQVLQQSLSNDMLVQQRVYKDFLSGNGFTFSDDGSISNYSEKLLAYEKNLKALEDKSKNSDNDKVKAEYEATREALDEVKKALSSYLDLTFNGIPKANETWLDLDNQIKDNIDSIKELQTQLKYFDEKVSIEKYENELGHINKELDILDSKLANMSGDAKIPVLQQQLELYKKQQIELHNLANSYREVQSQLKSYLSEQGFIFDEMGKIDNYEHLNNFAESSNLEEVTKALEQYINLTNKEIPSLSSKWWDVEKAIKDTINSIKDTKEELKNISNEINIDKYQNELGHINKELDILNSKLDNLSGQDRINAMQQQIDLFRQQQYELHNLANSYRVVQGQLKEFLSNKGFQFDTNGKVSNFDNLQNIDASAYEEVKKALEEYIDVTNNKIPDLSSKWWDVESSIKDVQDAIKELTYRNSLKPFENSIEEIGHALDRVHDKMDLLDNMYENVYGKDKLEYYDKKIALMEQEKELLKNQYDEYLNLHNVMKNNLLQFGVEFDDSSLITNYDEVLNKYIGSVDYDKIKEQLDEYIDLVRNDIPENWKKWLDLENQIKEANKQKLETTKKIEDQITDIYKKQIEERKKLIDSELKKRLDALNKEKEAYNDARAEADYEKSYDKQKEIIDKLQSQIDTASKDTSLSGQKKLQELLEQLKQEQEKLEDMVQDKIDSDVNSMIDKESDKLQQEAEDAKDKLDKEFSDDKIKDLVKEALGTGIFEDIDGQMKSLQDVMLDFVDEYGDGLSAIGDLIKNEMITNLEIAKDTMKDLSNILKDLDLKEYSVNLGRMSMPEISRSVSPINNYSSPTIQFNQPLVRVDGNVTKDAIPDLEIAIKDALDEFTSQLKFYTR